MLYISYSCVIALVSIPSTMLDGIEKVKILALWQILEEELMGFPIDYDGNSRLFLNDLYYIEEIFFFLYFVELLSWKDAELYQMFFLC
jgi:hypothetical protein